MKANMQQASKQQAGMQQVAEPQWIGFLAFRLVMIEQHSLLTAARMLKLELSQMGRLLHDVYQFLLAQAPGADDDTQAAKQQHLSRQLAAERLNHLETIALRCFQASQKVKQTLDRAALANGITEYQKEITPGHPRYLLAAARIADIASKFPLPTFHLQAMEACFGDVWDEPQAPVAEPESAENTPDGDCSEGPDLAAVFAEDDKGESVVSNSHQATSSEVMNQIVNSKMRRAGTVQPGDSPKTLPRSKQARRDAFFRNR